MSIQRDARRLVSFAHFDAILCDVMMDEGGGEAFYSWLQRERPKSAERVIFVTGGVVDEASRRFVEAQERPVLTRRSSATKAHTARMQQRSNEASRDASAAKAIDLAIPRP